MSEEFNLRENMHLLYFFLFCLMISANASAGFILQGGTSYTSYSDQSDSGDAEMTRIYNKLLIGASFNKKKTFYFGWNINSWSSNLTQGTNQEETYSMLEMGPRVQMFFNENYNFYFSAEWNPYAKGSRDKAGTSRDLEGSSYGVGVGFRYKFNKVVGFGVAVHYQSLSLTKQTINNTATSISDSVSNIIPMLEISIMGK